MVWRLCNICKELKLTSSFQIPDMLCHFRILIIDTQKKFFYIFYLKVIFYQLRKEISMEKVEGKEIPWEKQREILIEAVA